MEVITPTLLDIKRASEPSTLRVTLGSLERDQDQSRSILSGFAALLIILLVVLASCILWKWNSRKKRRVPYLRVSGMPSLTLPRPRQRAKNIYDLLPRRQEELGRHQPRSIRVFSAESLLSRNSESPEHVSSQADNALQMHRAHVPAVEYAVGIYDNATVPQMCGNLAPSVHYINVRASRAGSSSSSEESNDYVNVPQAEEIAETLPSTTSPSQSPFVLPSAQELEFTEERHEGCGDASHCTRFWSPGTEGSDLLSDGEDSSQTSNDYVNMAGLDLGDIQEEQSWEAFECLRDYENVPPADPNGSQQLATEEVTSSSTSHGEGRTEGPGTHIQPATRNSQSSGYYLTFQPSTQSEDSQMEHGEDTSSEDFNDYENVVIDKLGGRDWEQWPGTPLPPDERKPSCPAGESHKVVCPTGALTIDEPCEDP